MSLCCAYLLKWVFLWNNMIVKVLLSFKWQQQKQQAQDLCNLINAPNEKEKCKKAFNISVILYRWKFGALIHIYSTHVHTWSTLFECLLTLPLVWMSFLLVCHQMRAPIMMCCFTITQSVFYVTTLFKWL